ncbi:MAG: hypothetical protein HY550_04150 [Elusimicrobia bacterium]|nr:hypothetical protein [Elusimicrobiota bacterium]
MKNTIERGRSGGARRTFTAKYPPQPRSARQALKLAFYHLDAARFLLLAHRLHLQES